MSVGRYLQMTGAAIVFAAMASQPASAQTAKAAMKDGKGADVGTVTLSQTKKGVRLQLSLKGLPPGERAFHIHEVGQCEPPFTSAG